MASVMYEWVLSSNKHNSEQAKIVLAHAGAGVGYHIINSQRGKTEDVVSAFKRPKTASGFMPSHLERASKQQEEKLDQLDQKRRGAH